MAYVPSDKLEGGVIVEDFDRAANRQGTLASRARTFAAAAHASINHRRKYTDEPYIVHPMAVAAIVEAAGGSEAMIAAAYLHDVVEDTPVSLTEIMTEFGPEVARLVNELTDVSRPQDGNRKVRKAIDRAHSAAASPEGQTIKLADLIHNSETITAYDPDFAMVYMREKRALLEVMTEGDAGLQGRAWAIVRAWEATKP